jgi:hypothetical protein
MVLLGSAETPLSTKWAPVFGDERLTAALLDRLTHHAHRCYDGDEAGLFSVVKVQGGRFFVIKMGDFSMLKLIWLWPKKTVSKSLLTVTVTKYSLCISNPKNRF